MTISTLAATIAVLLFPAAMVYAGIMDLTTMKIRNGLVLFLLVAFAVLAPLAGFDVSEVGLSAATGLGVLVCAFVFFVLGWIGGGDAKLAAVAALWFGIDHTLAYFVYTALFGALLTLCLLQFRTRVLPARWQSRPWIARLHSAKSGVPYGVAMGLAALIVFPDTPWVASLS